MNWDIIMHWQKLNSILLITVSTLLLVSPASAYSANALSSPNPDLDVVLVMDSSGSMKQSDPKELRKPAAKLFISLLGTQDRASIVSFSDEGYPVAFLTSVKGSANQQKLFSAVDKISTRGVYTNLYGAIKTAAGILEKSGDPTHKHVIILMSDGKMDVGGLHNANDLNSKLLNELLPQLKTNHIELQTLAFTERSDLEFLEKIALATGGKYSIAHSDKDLHAVYTDIFEHNKQPNMIPFKGETFTIDNAIKEVTIVASKDAESVTLSLLDPKEVSYTEKNKPENIKWFSSKLFDLITISAPQTGPWKIKASSGKNKAYVITDLKFNLEVNPREPDIGEGVMVNAWLEDKGKVLDQQELQSTMGVKLQVHTPEDETHVLDMEADPQNGGHYVSLIALPSGGRHEIKVVASTSTFSRERNASINVKPQVEIESSTKVVLPPIVEPVKVDVTEENKSTNSHDDVASSITATDENKMPAQPVVESTEKPKVEENNHKANKEKPKSESKKTVEKEHLPETKEVKEDSHQKSTGLATALIVFIGVNAVLLLTGGIIYLIIYLKKKKSGEAENKTEDRDSEE